MKKRLTVFLFALLLVLALAAPALADVIPENQQYPNLVDEAGLLTDAEYDRLLGLLDEISQRVGCTVAVVTVDSLEGKSAQAFADDWYDYNGYGMGPGDDGVLLLVSMRERAWAVTDYGKATSRLMRSYDALCDSFLPYMSDGDWYEAFRTFASGCDKALSGKTLRTFDADRALELLPICLIIALIASLPLMSTLRGQVKNVRLKQTAADYTRPGSMYITNGYEDFRNRVVSKTAKAESSSGSGTHRSSSGRSHGGRSGHF